MKSVKLWLMIYRRKRLIELKSSGIVRVFPTMKSRWLYHRQSKEKGSESSLFLCSLFADGIFGNQRPLMFLFERDDLYLRQRGLRVFDLVFGYYFQQTPLF